MFAFLFARLGLLAPESTERAVILSSTIFLSGGIVGCVMVSCFYARSPELMQLPLMSTLFSLAARHR